MSLTASTHSFYKTFWPLLLVSTLLLGSILFVSHYLDYRATLKNVRGSELVYAGLGYHAIQRELELVTSDLRNLANSEVLRQFIQQGSVDRRELLEKEYLTFSRSKGLYDQIRFLDQNGQERIRVNYNLGDPVIVPADQLQNKGQRYYFTDTFELQNGKIFISPLDLNIEHGEIERPLKPMLRIGTPVVDDQGHKRGILLFNYFGNTLIQRLDVVMNLRGASMLVNGDGFWLNAPDPADEWGFMFDNDRSFANRYQSVWQTILGQNQGQVMNDAGLFSFATIYPLVEGQFSSTGAARAFIPSAGEIDEKKYFWKVISHIEPTFFDNMIDSKLRIGFVQLLSLMILVVPGAWLFARYRFRNREQAKTIRRSEETLRNISDQMAEGLLLVDYDGCISFCNHTASRLLGCEENESIESLNFHDLVHEHPQQESCQLRMALKECASGRILEDRFQRKDDTELPVSYTLSPLRQGEESAAIILTFQDITERKAMEQQMVRAETMGALGGMVAGIAHEINTPVGVAVTAASHLQRRTNDLQSAFQDGALKKSALADYLAAASEVSSALLANLKRASQLIASFKQVATDQVSEARHRIKVKEYLESVILILRPKLKQTRHRVELVCDEDLQVAISPGALSQVVTNLVINSIIHAFPKTQAGNIRIAAEQKGDILELIYSDDGRGISPRDLRRIFDPFFTTNRGGGSTGLGMHIVYNIVTDVMQGTIEVDSQPDQGVRFNMRFPISVNEQQRYE